MSTSEGSLDRLIGQQVKRWRLFRQLEQVELVERLTSRGGRYDTHKLSRIERGQPVRVTQLLELALALDVPPVALVAPLDDNAEGPAWERPVQLTDRVVMRVGPLFQWLVGMDPPINADRARLDRLGPMRPSGSGQGHREGPPWRDRFHHASRVPIAWFDLRATQRWFFRQHQAAQHLRDVAKGARDTPLGLEDPDELDKALAGAEEAEAIAGKRYAQAIRKAWSLGVTPPAEPRSIVGALARIEGRYSDQDAWLAELGLTIMDDTEDGR